MMQTYNEFFRFAPHSFLTSYIVYVSGVFEDRRDSINLNALYRELSKSIQIQDTEKRALVSCLNEARLIFSKVKILRDNAFAHKTNSQTYDDVFVRADVKPSELRDLTDIGLKTANQLLNLCGYQEQVFAQLPLRATKQMMRDLGSIVRR